MTNNFFNVAKWRIVPVAVALILLICATSQVKGQVKSLPVLHDVEKSSLYRLYINDTEIPLAAELSANQIIETASFQFTGKVSVRVYVGKPFKTCVIRPLRFELRRNVIIRDKPLNEIEIQFTLEKPGHYILELDGLPHLVLICSVPDTDLPNPKDPNVIYFGPGVHEPGRIRLKSNQTVFLDAGAKVYGTIEGFCVENVRVTGRGHLYGTKHTDWNRRTYGLVFDRCRNVTVEKIGIRDCYWWVTEFLLCDQVKIHDINLFSFNRNNGGLMIDSCSNLTASDSLLMCRDDCVCPHALNAAGNGEVKSDNMLFENLVLYNVIDGNGIRIGASFETSEVNNWAFKNIDVVARHGAAIFADHSDWAIVRNLVFENFNDESFKKKAIDMFINKTKYSCQTGYRDARGQFDGLQFINFQSKGGKISLKGFDQEHAFSNVVFTGCKIGNKAIKLSDFEKNEFVKNVKVLNAADSAERILDQKHNDLATKVTPSDPLSPRELVVDDSDKQFRSFGFKQTAASDRGHNNTFSTGQVIDQFGKYAAAIYEPKITGRYEISAYVGKHNGVDTKSPWIIRHRNGYSCFFVNQNDNPGWHRLGVFEFNSESNVRLVYPNYFEPTSKPVVADAVKFLTVE